jgi:hypothetical protein
LARKKRHQAYQKPNIEGLHRETEIFSLKSSLSSYHDRSEFRNSLPNKRIEANSFRPDTAERAHQVKVNFANRHEIRTPLSIIDDSSYFIMTLTFQQWDYLNKSKLLLSFFEIVNDV